MPASDTPYFGEYFEVPVAADLRPLRLELRAGELDGRCLGWAEVDCAVAEEPHGLLVCRLQSPLDTSLRGAFFWLISASAPVYMCLQVVILAKCIQK